MLLDHHANRDSVNEIILRNLAPRVMVQQNWLSPQPGEEVVTRMASRGLYPGPRDVFATGMSPESREVIGPIMDSIYKRYGGHVVVRVRSEEHTSELQSLMRISYAVFCLKKKTKTKYSTNRE